MLIKDHNIEIWLKHIISSKILVKNNFVKNLDKMNFIKNSGKENNFVKNFG